LGFTPFDEKGSSENRIIWWNLPDFHHVDENLKIDKKRKYDVLEPHMPNKTSGFGFGLKCNYLM